jgi:hypothetical protein
MKTNYEKLISTQVSAALGAGITVLLVFLGNIETDFLLLFCISYWGTLACSIPKEEE